jgi:hypothetical protein
MTTSAPGRDQAASTSLPAQRSPGSPRGGNRAKRGERLPFLGCGDPSCAVLARHDHDEGTGRWQLAP